MNKTILIAEDDSGILDAMKMMLELQGYTVVFTTDGDKVVKMMNQKPDLVLLDILMSGMDGRTICKMLKGQDSTKKTPIVMVSASKDVEESARMAGANDFLAKPFEMDDLLAMVDKYVR